MFVYIRLFISNVYVKFIYGVGEGIGDMLFNLFVRKMFRRWGMMSEYFFSRDYKWEILLISEYLINVLFLLLYKLYLFIYVCD